MEIKRKLFVVLIGFLLKFFSVTANEFQPQETRQNISYTIGANIKLCLTPINYSLCEHAAMKLSYKRENSDTHVPGTLLYNIVYSPEVKVVASINTTEYGFNNFTSARNETSLCLYFSGISTLANNQKYEVHQICDVKKLDKEKTHLFTFYLVPSSSNATTIPFAYSPTDSTVIENTANIENTSNTGLPSITTSQAPKVEDRGDNGLSRGEIAGIVVGSILMIIVIVTCVFCWPRCQKKCTKNSNRTTSPETELDCRGVNN